MQSGEAQPLTRGLSLARPRVSVAGLERVLPLSLAGVFALVYGAFLVWQFDHLAVTSWDNAIFEQALKGYATGSAPIVDIKGPGYNLLGDHFGPALAVLAPFYALFPSGKTLLVAQAVALGASVFPIARLAIYRLGLQRGATVAVAYGLSFGVLAAMAVQFHLVCLAAPLLAFAGEAFADRRWRAVVLWCLPLLLIKESMGLLLAGVGAALVVAGARRLGVATIVGGVAATLLTVFVVIPAFNPAGHYDYLATSGGIGQSWEHLTSGLGKKATTLLLTFGATGFLALRSPWALVAGAELAWRFVGSNEFYWGTGWHYSLLTMVVLFPALVDAAGKVQAGWLRSWAGQVPAVALTVSLVCLLAGPTRWVRPAHPDAERVAAVGQAVAMIPVGATVEADMQLVGRVVADHRAYFTGTVDEGEDVEPPEWFVLTTDGWLEGYDPVRYAEGQHPGALYSKVYDVEHIVVLERVGMLGR